MVLILFMCPHIYAEIALAIFGTITNAWNSDAANARTMHCIGCKVEMRRMTDVQIFDLAGRKELCKSLCNCIYLQCMRTLTLVCHACPVPHMHAVHWTMLKRSCVADALHDDEQRWAVAT